MVWMEGTDGAYVVKARLVSPAGNMGSVLTISQHDSFYYNPVCVAYGAGRFMVVWHYNADENAAWDLRGRIVLADGTLGSDELILADGPNAEFAWANNVVFDGQHFLVVWTDYQGGPPAGQGTVLGRYWNTDGSPVGASFTIADAFDGQLGVGLSTGNGKVLSLINPNAFTQDGDVCAKFITRPFVQVGSVEPQGIEMSFNGVIEYSTNLQTWLEYDPQPSSPWTNPIGNGNMFFRARVRTNSTAP